MVDRLYPGISEGERLVVSITNVFETGLIVLSRGWFEAKSTGLSTGYGITPSIMEQRFAGGRGGLTPEEEAQLQLQEYRVRAVEERRRREEEQVFPSTEIENSVIANMAEIGVYPYAVYSVLKMHQESGEANPSYATIARMTGMDRSTVIRSVKKLTDSNLLSPVSRFKQDGLTSLKSVQFAIPRISITTPFVITLLLSVLGEAREATETLVPSVRACAGPRGRCL